MDWRSALEFLAVVLSFGLGYGLSRRRSRRDDPKPLVDAGFELGDGSCWPPFEN